jgi:hypothetical protein
VFLRRFVYRHGLLILSCEEAIHLACGMSCFYSGARSCLKYCKEGHMRSSSSKAGTSPYDLCCVDRKLNPIKPTKYSLSCMLKLINLRNHRTFPSMLKIAFQFGQRFYTSNKSIPKICLCNLELTSIINIRRT